MSDRPPDPHQPGTPPPGTPADDSPTQVGMPAVGQPGGPTQPGGPEPSSPTEPAYGQQPGYGQQPDYGQQPGYGQQPDYGQGAAPPGYGPPPGYRRSGYGQRPPRRRRSGGGAPLAALLGLALVVLLAIGGMYLLGVGPFAPAPDGSPSPTPITQPTPSPDQPTPATPTEQPTPEPTPTEQPTPDQPTPEPTPTDQPTPEPTPTEIPTPEPTAPATPAVTPAAYGQLLGWVAPAIRPTCERIRPRDLLDDAVAGAQCEAPDGVLRQFVLFDDAEALQEAYLGVKEDLSPPPEDGTCPTDLPAEAAWYYDDTAEEMRGDYLCYLDPGGQPWVVFTAWHAGMFGLLWPSEGSSANMANLYDVFRADSGVLPPGQWTP
jgi:hypothetical protein